MTKIAFGCASVDVLEDRIRASMAGGADAHVITTRYKPTRADEMVGGSLFWIVEHRIVVRETILGFAQAEGGRCAIRLSGTLVPVTPRPKRAHQGWRYLKPEDAPEDLARDADVGTMPRALIDELAGLGLI